jgi:hypothetical protein
MVVISGKICIFVVVVYQEIVDSDASILAAWTAVMYCVVM